jgi:hypothetical protein
VRCRCGQLHHICSNSNNAPANGDVYEYACPINDTGYRLAATSVTYLHELPSEAVPAQRITSPRE